MFFFKAAYQAPGQRAAMVEDEPRDNEAMWGDTAVIERVLELQDLMQEDAQAAAVS